MESDADKRRNVPEEAAAEEKTTDESEELLEEELDRVAGGLHQIRTCTQCKHNVAVHGMDVCAACFRQQINL